MTSFSAIVKLTCRSAIRSHVFRTLTFLLLLSVLLIPNTIKGDGTATGFIQLILEYSLGFAAALLCISAAWVACSEIATDVENGQLHLLAVKPVSRFRILLGKFTGVLVIHGILLLFAAAIVYAFVIYQYARQDFPADEKQRVENEVFCGRRLYAPKKPDFDALAVKELDRRLSNAREDERRQLAEKTTGTERRATLEALKKEIRVSMCESAPGEIIFWEYEGIPDDSMQPFYLRFKVFPGDSSSMNQDSSYGAWLLRFMAVKDEGNPAEGREPEYTEQILSFPPEEIITAAQSEFCIQETVLRMNGVPDSVRSNIPADTMKNLTAPLIHKNTVKIGFCNFDRSGKKLIFQEPDGPFLLVRETGFLNNYLRAVLVIFLGIAAVSLVASGLAAYFTLPTSIFMSVSYGVLCMASSYLVSSYQTMEDLPLDFSEKVAKYLSRALMALMIPVQDFFLTTQLSTGQLIEFSTVGHLILYHLVFRGLPIFLLGAFLYYRRELALAMKR